MSENVLLTLSSMSFMMSCLICKSLSHLEFIFVHGVRVCSSFIDLPAAVQFYEHHWLKRLFPILFFYFYLLLLLYLFIYLFFAISWAAPTACGGFQARDRIRAVAASLCQSHSKLRSEPHMQPTPQLTAMPDP